MDRDNIIQSLTESELVLIFVVILDGMVTLAGLVKNNFYSNNAIALVLEAQPAFAGLVSNSLLWAILSGLAWAATLVLIFRMLKGNWQSLWWHFAILSHTLGAISWVLPQDSLSYLWVLAGNTWLGLIAVEIAMAVMITYVFGDKIRKSMFT